MTQSNQSELEEATPEYRFGYDITKICLANGGVTEPMVEKLYDYITANYTPNSQVADKVNTAVVTRELELDHQWSKELERAVLRGKIEMLNNLDKLHARTYHQTVTDNMGKVYVDESHGYISKYETQEMIARLEAVLQVKMEKV